MQVVYIDIGSMNFISFSVEAALESIFLTNVNFCRRPPIKYQYEDLGKLYHVVMFQVRRCDVSSKTMSSVPGNKRPLNNPFAEECSKYLMPIQTQA